MCKVHDIAENNSNRTISELDLCILVIHYWKSKGHNCVENYSTGPKFKLNLRILVTHLYTEFQFKMLICNGDNERKLKINGIVLSPRGITLPKAKSRKYQGVFEVKSRLKTWQVRGIGLNNWSISKSQNGGRN